MLYIKNLFIILIAFAFITVSLQAQDEKNKSNEENPEQTQTMEETKEFSSEQFNRKLSSLNEEPDDEVERQFGAIADKTVNQIAQKMNIDEDAREDIRESIIEYLDTRWEKEVEIAKESNDPEEVQEHSTDLAYLRVELAEEIKDEFSDEEESQWNNHAVEFWKSLDWDVFSLQMQKTGIATGSADDDISF